MIFNNDSISQTSRVNGKINQYNLLYQHEEKVENYMITSVDAEKAFDKTEFLLVVKKKKKKLLANLEEKGNSLI